MVLPIRAGFYGVVLSVFALLTALKLSHALHWPWVIVTLPIWGLAVIDCILFIFYAGYMLADKRKVSIA